ncbi:uncharacterized protein LOC143017829 isoform X2 [Oratosquilla oratoria]
MSAIFVCSILRQRANRQVTSSIWTGCESSFKLKSQKPLNIQVFFFEDQCQIKVQSRQIQGKVPLQPTQEMVSDPLEQPMFSKLSILSCMLSRMLLL